MKNFLVRIFIFFAVVALIDFVFGVTCRYLNSHAKGGDTRLHYYIAKECDKDILIFGSSRAMHHYDPRIIEDSLGMSCYNCGEDGNGIVFLYSRILAITDRYSPELVVYDIQPEFDVKMGDNSRYLKWQKRLYDTPGISEVFELTNPNETLKMKSNLYQYNESFVQMLMDNIHPMQEVSYGGYRPKYANMSYVPEVKQLEQLTEWDPVKKECLIRFVNLCREKGIKLIFSFSPSFGGIRPSCNELVKQFVEEYNVPIIDHYSDSTISLNPDFFYDSVHMNADGAELFTNVILKDIKKIL